MLLCHGMVFCLCDIYLHIADVALQPLRHNPRMTFAL
jgi:hypothetical protein